VARRCWSGSKLAHGSIQAAMRDDDGLQVTLPHDVDNTVDNIINATLAATVVD